MGIIEARGLGQGIGYPGAATSPGVLHPSAEVDAVGTLCDHATSPLGKSLHGDRPKTGVPLGAHAAAEHFGLRPLVPISSVVRHHVP